MLVRSDSPGAKALTINVCPRCLEGQTPDNAKIRRVLSATSTQAAQGLAMCPVHGVMHVSELGKNQPISQQV